MHFASDDSGSVVKPVYQTGILFIDMCICRFQIKKGKDKLHFIKAEMKMVLQG